MNYKLSGLFEQQEHALLTWSMTAYSMFYLWYYRPNFLGSVQKAQEMREGRKGWKEERKERGTRRTERRTD